MSVDASRIHAITCAGATIQLRLDMTDRAYIDTSAIIALMDASQPERGRRRPSLTDCLSFETTREFQPDPAFAFDQDFVDAGVVTVP